MYLSAFPHLLRAPGEDSGPCSSLIIQPSYRTRHIANTFKKPGSKSLTPSTCNANGGGGQDTGQCLAVLYPDPFSLYTQCQLTVDGHVDWDLNQTLANLSTFLVNDIKLLSSSNTLPPCASQKENLPFPPWFFAFFLLKLFLIQCLGNESHPSSSSNPFATKHTLSFGNDQGGSNKKPRQDDNGDNDYPRDPDDPGDSGHNDNNDGETPEGKGAGKGKEKDEPLYCCAFYKVDPVKYRKCGHLEIKSVAYFLQHIIRQHLLDDKHYHCDNCRFGWPKDGRNSDTQWEEHTRVRTCQRVTLEELGKLLPEEHRRLKRKLKEKPAGSEFERWYKVWEQLFPGYKRPDSPYLSNEAEEIEASNVRRLDGILDEDLSQMPPGPERDRIEAFTRRLIERAFPAHARQGSANAGPSTSRAPEHAPQTIGRHRAPVTTPASTPAPRPLPAGPVIGTRTPAGHRAPPHRPMPNTSDRHPGSARFPTNPGLTMNHGGPPANYMPMDPTLLGNPAFARHPGLTNARLPVDPRLMDARLLENPALTMNSGMMNTADPGYLRITGQAGFGLVDYGTPTNPGNSMGTINPRLLTNSGLPNTRSPANPRPSAHPPSNPINIQHPNRNAFRRNNNTNGFDHAAFALSVDRGIEAFNSLSQDPEQPSDTDDYPETVQNPWRRVP
ncbi:hypothetical protein FALCPG4_014485 [Fusarium falciforme]